MTTPVSALAETLGLPQDVPIPYGRAIAKIPAATLEALPPRPGARLILVSAINPTTAGEGKTTTSIGLADGLRRRGRRVMLCLREPSLGPVFGRKGGATGGGKARVQPSDEINLHFTGDMHAVSSAHNLLAALIDNHLHFGKSPDIDRSRIAWRRVVDLNDRALREIEIGRGAKNGPVRPDGFDITVASEVMAILCLARNLGDLRRRLGDILVGHGTDGAPVAAKALEADGAMTALLRRALDPNLVATDEGTPAFVHGGPFANIAHGCNSLIATTGALKLADYVVTEAGFGADLGAQKFLDIKCQVGGIAPSAAVIVATVRALKMHGGAARDDLVREDVAALERGFGNLARHVGNMRRYGLPVVIAINRFTADTNREIGALKQAAQALGAVAVLADPFGRGGEGCVDLADAVVAAAAPGPVSLAHPYPAEAGLAEKVRAIACNIYGAAGIEVGAEAAWRFAEIEAMGLGHLPICIAKTQYSFSADPSKLGAPTGHVLPVRDAVLARGAGFVVVMTGAVLRMPGLPREPAARHISVNDAGDIVGLH